MRARQHFDKNTPGRSLARAPAATRAFVEDLHAWLSQDEGLEEALEWGALAAGYEMAWIQRRLGELGCVVASSSAAGSSLRQGIERLACRDVAMAGMRMRYLGPSELPTELLDSGLRSVVLVPLGAGFEGWDALVVGSLREQRPSVQQRAVLDTLAQTLGLALVARHLLLEQRQHARIASLLATAASLDESAERLGEELRALVDHDVAALQVNEHGWAADRVWRMSNLDARRHSVPYIALPEHRDGGDGTRGRADVAETLRGEEGTQFLLSAPLRVGTHRVGMLVLGRHDRHFDASETASLFGIAPVVASAVDRMRLEERLRAAEQAATLGGMGRLLSHELRNPLNGLTLRVQLLERQLRRTELGGIDKSAIEDHVAAFRREIERLDRVVHDCAGLSRGTPLKLEHVDLAELVDEVRSTYDPRMNDGGIHLSVPVETRPALARIDRSKILLVLDNLMRNAMEALEGRSDGAVCIELEGVGEWWEVRIRDNGPGIEDTRAVFKPGHSSKSLGGGMGLTICRQVVSLHQGRIAVRRPADGGAELVVALRREQPTDDVPAHAA